MSYSDLLPKGATSKVVEVIIRSSTTGQGKTAVAAGDVTARYMRAGAAANVAIVLAAGTLGTWSSGGWVEVDATNQPGLYQFGIPDAALASGADAVTIGFKVSGALDKSLRILLLDDDLRGVAAALLDKSNGIEAGYTLKQALRLVSAVLAGKVSGGPDAPAFRSLDDSAARVVMSADSSGNRTSVTLSP